MKPSITSATLLTVAVAASAKSVVAIGSPFQVNETFCGQWDIRANDQIILYNNHWGAYDDVNGTQCTTVTDISASGAISYTTNTKWAGTTWQVKSFTNIETILDPLRAYEIKSIPAKCTINATDMLDFDSRPVYNAAFDLFFSSNASSDATPAYEVMVWVLARNGAAPLQQYGLFDMTIDGRNWTLQDGSNGGQRVLSFTSADEIDDVDLDLQHFVDAAVQHAMPQDLYLIKVQGGFEYFHGESTLVVSNYQVSITKDANAEPVTTQAPYLPTISKGGQCNFAGAQCETNTFCMPWNPSYSQCIDTPAQCPVTIEDTEILGSTIMNITDILPAACCSACANTTDCKAYTFDNYNPDGHAVCYLKSASTPRQASSGVISAELVV